MNLEWETQRAPRRLIAEDQTRAQSVHAGGPSSLCTAIGRPLRAAFTEEACLLKRDTKTRSEGHEEDGRTVQQLKERKLSGQEPSLTQNSLLE